MKDTFSDTTKRLIAVASYLDCKSNMTVAYNRVMHKVGSTKYPLAHHVLQLESKENGISVEQTTITRVKNSLAKFLEKGQHGRKLFSEDLRVSHLPNNQRKVAIKSNSRVVYSRQQEPEGKQRLFKEA